LPGYIYGLIRVADPDPRSGAFLIPGSGIGKKIRIRNNPDHTSESLETIFGLKYVNSLMRIRDPGWKKFGSWIWDWDEKNSDPGSGINILDPQHWFQLTKKRNKYCNLITVPDS
jgi:hypothetical protein